MEVYLKGKCKKIQKTLIVWIIKSIRLLTKVNLYRWNIFSIGVAGKYIFPAMFPIIPEVNSISKFMYGRIYKGMESISGL